jgi:sensor histidine kinase regulating citrate/malate metabolism
MYVGKKTELDETNGLLVRAETIAATINPESIKSLSATLDDLNKPAYQDLKSVMTKLHAVNKDTRFVYVMGLADDKQFFYVDSEDPNSKDYSYPGQPYNDADAGDIANHKDGKAYTKGPYVDQWGRWFSAYAPIWDKDGHVVGLVGMDIAAENLLLRISIVKQAIMIISSLLFLSVLLLVIFAQATKRKDVTQAQS